PAGAAGLPASLTAAGTAVEPFVPLDGSRPTVVFPLLHGPFGEDGTVQGLCELAGVADVGAGVLGAAVSMDKLAAKRMMEAAGLPVPRYIGLRESERNDGLGALVGGELGWPVFVKPANLGSSVGVSRAAGGDELDAALALAAQYDEWLIVEEAI